MIQKLMAGRVFDWWEGEVGERGGLKCTTREPGDLCAEGISGEQERLRRCARNLDSLKMVSLSVSLSIAPTYSAYRACHC